MGVPPSIYSARKRRKSQRSLRSYFYWVVAGGLIAVITVLALGYAFYSTRAGLIDIDVVKKMPKASLLYDYQGRSFSRFFEENRIAMPPNKPVPKLLGEAVVAQEDRRFYQHGAIDPYGIARAFVMDILGRGSREGGSTITQQLARNSIGQLQRTYDRKFLEIFLAHRIETAYTKEQILRYYLDRIYFGQGLYGAETTAYAFFGVSVENLNLAQCALLAGMISSPNASSPWKDIKAAKAARDRALERMVKAGYITTAQQNWAHKAPLGLKPRPDFGGGFATSEVRRQLEQILDTNVIEQGGLKIFTTIDSKLQTQAEGALAARIDQIERATGRVSAGGDPNTGLPDEDVLEGAFFAMDPQTGSIRAVVGSRDFALSQYNRAMQAQRQIGSTIKPLIYATAFAEKGYCPASTIDATPFDLKAPGPIPADQGEAKMMRINDALVTSDDYAAPRMAEIVGYPLLNDYAHRCGATVDIPAYRSSALGAFDMSLNELTGIYATFANQGVWVKQHIVVQVRDDHDRIIYQYQPEGRRVFTPQVARQVTGMMENVIGFGTGAPVRQVYNFQAPAAGKTGTTNDYKDAWFEGFTTHLVAGVWIGYDTPREIMAGGYGAQVALPVWATVMKQAQASYEMKPFPLPDGLLAVNVGGDFFGRGETYYLAPDQRGLLQSEPASSGDEGRPNIIQSFLNLFR